MTDGRTDGRMDGRTDGGDCNIPYAFLKKRGDNESQLQTYESKTLFLMTSLQYYCIPGLAGTH